MERLIYDGEKMVEILVSTFNFTDPDARVYLVEEIIKKYLGVGTPIILLPAELGEIEDWYLKNG